MKWSYFSFVFALLLLLSFGHAPLRVKVEVENLSGETFEGGTLKIPKLNKSFTIDDEKNVDIYLEKGDYKFVFIPKNKSVSAIVFHPKIISKSNDVVKIQIHKNKTMIDTTLDSSNVEQRIKEKKARFISFGISPMFDKAFSEKYGVEFTNLGCVMTETLMEQTSQNNKIIGDFLTKKFGKDWKADLQALPYGLER